MWIDRRILVFGLAASLLINIFLIGVLGVRAYANRRPDRPGGPMVRAVDVHALPQDQRRAYRQAIGRHRAIIRDLREKHRAMRLATEEDIAAPAFDRDKIEADFAGLRNASVALQQAYNDALIDALQDLPASARSTLVRRNADPR